MLWLVSGVAACAFAVVLAGGSLNKRWPIWLLARVVVNVTRGVPTSILVIAGGLFALRFAGPIDLPILFPGTHAAFQHVAWTLALVLALGSAGHLAEIFRAAYEALGGPRRDELTVLGLPRWRHLIAITTESALVGLPATGARLVHHLHNTAFAALFPVADLFGAVLTQAYTTFRVMEAALVGSGVYILLSAAIWSAFKVAETVLRHGITAPVPALGKASA
jgi:ABC-type amino acid transport system permease subunit